MAVLINIIILGWQLKVLFSTSPDYSYVKEDMPRELPIKVEMVNMAFHDDPDHYALTGAQAWAEWNEIRPPGKGHVFLGDAYYPFGVSMWHQIHCLNHIRTVLINGDDGSDHTEHCFHYLRQSLLCFADTTLEYGGTRMHTKDGGLAAVGMNVTHTCRNWKQVHDYLEEEQKKWTPDMMKRFKEASDGTNNRAVSHNVGHTRSGI